LAFAKGFFIFKKEGFLENLLPLETLYLQGFQTPKDTARRAPSGMPQKRTESAFKRTSIFIKTAIMTPVFGLFLTPLNYQTLINSHFQFLKE